MKKSLKPHNTNKPRWSLLPYDTLEEVVKAFMVGAKKYKDDNWKQNVQDYPRDYKDALMRHYKEFMTGIKDHDNTGIHPLAFLCANALILLWHEMEDKDISLPDGYDIIEFDKNDSKEESSFKIAWLKLKTKYGVKPKIIKSVGRKFHTYGIKKSTKKLKK